MFFVRDFEGNPDRAERKIFRSRPRLAGLWVRMTFKDTEVLEALLANNLLDVDPLGFLVTPPDVYSNNLRIFIPRTALTEMEVLGVISDGVVRRMSQRAAQARVASTGEQQFGLFASARFPGKEMTGGTSETASGGRSHSCVDSGEGIHPLAGVNVAGRRPPARGAIPSVDGWRKGPVPTGRKPRPYRK